VMKQRRADSRGLHVLEFHNLIAQDIEVPLEVGAHLPLHLIDLLAGKHMLCDYGPRTGRVGVIADDLRGDNEGRKEESVAR
jgi:hypothetical protein